MQILKNVIQGLSSLVYPRTCLVCRKSLKSECSDALVCLSCWSDIKLNTPPFCFKCGRKLLENESANNICFDCTIKVMHFDRAFSPCSYDGTIKKLLHAFKYKNIDYLDEILAKPMIDFVKEYNLPINKIDMIIPIPLHKTKIREREFNQSSLLAKHISKEFNKEISEGLLIRHLNTRTQTELNDRDRLTNIKGAFSIKDRSCVKDKDVLLIDDVLTTGATCSEAAFVLKNSGAKSVFVLTLAN